MIKYPMFRKEIDELKKLKLLRKVRDRESPQGRTIMLNGREYLSFSSNDYLGLASRPDIINASADALRAYGFGAGASRLLSGGCILHKELERKIASFKGTEAALLFNSGYAANTGAIPALVAESEKGSMTHGKGSMTHGKGSMTHREGSVTLFSDELNHASIIDGCRLSKAETRICRHKDVGHLEKLLADSTALRKIVITDSVFSMNGGIAPLKDIYRLCKKHSALLYLDDAHGTGVIGGHDPRFDGKGALSHFALKPEPFVIQMGTLSKAMGSFGAFVAGGSDVIEWLRNSARSFMFSTALPAPVVAASIAALGIIENDDSLIKKLWENRERLFNAVHSLGLDTGESETPIVPLMMKDIESAVKLSEHLFDNGIYAPAIRPPTVKQPRIRLTVTALHTEEDIERLRDALKAFSPA